MTLAIPLIHDLVLIGGGHTHALVLRRWGMKPLPGVRVTLINPGVTAPYSGMLPGHVAGHYSHDDLQIDLVKMARFAGARLILGAVTGIDRTARKIIVAGAAAPIGYDIASLDVGVTSDMPHLPGFKDHGLPAKPLDRFAQRWARFCDAPPATSSIVVIGGGVAGVELAMAARHRLLTLGTKPRVTIIERHSALSVISGRARRKLQAALFDQDIIVLENTTVQQVGHDTVTLAGGQMLPADLTIGAAGARPHPWLADLGLATHNGYIIVDPALRSVSDTSVYAVGDCAHMARAPRPKAGVFAVRAAPILAHNLRADLTSSARRRYNPQGDYLKLVTLGAQSAMAEKFGAALSGPVMWRWKDRIDRKFMDQFDNLPVMTPPPIKGRIAKGVRTEMAGPVPCGGCGAKLGRAALTGALAALPHGTRDDIRSRPGDDAAVLVIGGKTQVITTDHLRAFTEDPALLARVAAIHAMGDIWAMGATPQAALASITLPRLSARLQAAWLEEIMAEAARVFTGTGAEIVGGHSSAGAELSIGFTVTGLTPDAPITLAGAQSRDVLILTRPLGTGVVLAAEMAMQARACDVASCWHQMATPQGDASAILAPLVHAMTDVTGFGLAGHLHGICQASGVGAEVSLDNLPLLPGALAASKNGIRSSLYADNRTALDGEITGAEGPLAALVFDPQTSGGLLAAVPRDAARTALPALHAAGHKAAIIGRIVEGAPLISLQ